MCEILPKCVKFACNYFKNSSASAGLCPQTLPGLRSWTPLGDWSPDPCGFAAHPKLPSAAYVAFPWTKLSFRPRNVRSHINKALFEAWEREIAEIAGLGTALSCVHTHFNPGRSNFCRIMGRCRPYRGLQGGSCPCALLPAPPRLPPLVRIMTLGALQGF